jgi:hypothetical protein
MKVGATILCYDASTYYSSSAMLRGSSRVNLWLAMLAGLQEAVGLNLLFVAAGTSCTLLNDVNSKLLPEEKVKP